MKRVIVRGPALSQSGYGEHARFVLRALRSRPELFDIYLINTPWGATGWVWEDNEEREWIDHLLQKTVAYGQQKNVFDLSLQVTIPNEWDVMAPINVGVTAGTETTKISPEWMQKINQGNINKIVVVSEHAKQAFVNTVYVGTHPHTKKQVSVKTEPPIEVVGYPVKQIKPAELELVLKDDINFLVVGTWIPRKNLENTIKWFVEEFHDNACGLIIKTSLAKNCLRDREATADRLEFLLKNYQDRKCNVYLLHGDMSEQEMTGLYQHKKIRALISLAHGEGFGLPMFEAAYNGLPIIAPPWGGQCDFLYIDKKDKKGKVKKQPMFTPVSYDLKPIQKEAVWNGVLQEDSEWCFPKEWDYKRALKLMMKNYGPANSKAKKLQKWICENFSEDIQYEKFVKTVEGYCDDSFKQNQFDKFLDSFDEPQAAAQ